MTRPWPSSDPAYRRARLRIAQADTAATARRHGLPWSPWDDYVVLWGDGTLRDRALVLERTYHGVAQRRMTLLAALRASERASRVT